MLCVKHVTTEMTIMLRIQQFSGPEDVIVARTTTTFDVLLCNERVCRHV